MKTLDEIGIEQQTDQASQFTRTYAQPHDYLRHMDFLFRPLRDERIKIIEIGIGGGESVQTWLEYFQNGMVYGVDIVEKTNPWNTPKSGVHPRYTFLQGNQSDKTMWACFLADCGLDFDIVIDDGSHEPKDIITSFNCLWQILKPGGLYCVEDIGCGFTNPGFPSHLDWLRGMLDTLNQGKGNVDSIYFSRELAILKKSLCTP